MFRFFVDKNLQSKIDHLRKMYLMRIFTIILILVFIKISQVFSLKRDNPRKGDSNSKNNFLKNNLTSGNYFLYNSILSSYLFYI